jgi:prepilin-type N-terminal cleavage/methylation domain-containing protein
MAMSEADRAIGRAKRGTAGPHQRCAGLTLIESIIAIAILGVFAALAAPVLLQHLRAYEMTASDLATLDKLRYATERLAREWRLADYDPVTGAFQLTASATAPVFTKTDGVTVTLSQGSGIVTLAYSTPALAATLTDELGALAFAYYDRNGAPTADPAQIRYVEIDLSLVNPKNAKTYRQRTRVALRDRS